MILSRLELTNYKQFAGNHVIDFPNQGAVGVLGQNGAGKTTLFEAIEWCLYGPKTIKHDEIRPRLGTGDHPKVTVTLEDPDNGVRYIVERRLRSRAAQADIYREDDPDTTIVSGPSDVSKYVATKLIGLSHQAFVATFFTRQKELTFFGDVKDTDRRRQVARLLGLDTIRLAQERIRSERSEARERARVFRDRYEADSAGRDFPTELAAIGVRVAERERALAEARTLEETRQREALAANAAADWCTEEQRQDQTLAHEINVLDGKITQAERDRERAIQELAELDTMEEDLRRLRPIAAAEVERQATVGAFDTERERARQQALLREQRERATREHTQQLTALRRLVTEPLAFAIEGWSWTSADDADPRRAADRLERLARRLDVTGSRARADAMSSAAEWNHKVRESSTQVQRFTDFLHTLEGQLATLVKAGDPEVERNLARTKLEEAQAGDGAAQARAHAAHLERQKLERALAQLSDAGEGECPTCLRPFGGDEADAVHRAITLGIDARRKEEHIATERAVTAREQAEMARADLARAEERIQERTQLGERIQNGREKITDEEARRDTASDELANALAIAGLKDPPSGDTVHQARIEADTIYAVACQADRIADLGQRLTVIADEDDRSRDQLAELGEVTYDAEAHDAAKRALNQAHDAKGRVETIERHLERRDEHQQSRQDAEASLARCQTERETVHQRRKTLGYDPEAAARVFASRETARQTHLDAITTANGFERGLDEVKGERRELEHLQARLADDLKRSEDAQRAYHQLDAMDREFTAFDGWIAERIAPHLSDTAGDLLAAVTDGRYTRVTFDKNYGLHVYDGDESFPVSQFSGGERDVAALCARLALSRVIGSQAADPPAFVVLDEVFGALDRDRRAQLLTMLNGLTGDQDAFRQLFIISHVDDVQMSQGFDEVWRVQTTGQGMSEFENLTQTAQAIEG